MRKSLTPGKLWLAATAAAVLTATAVPALGWQEGGRPSTADQVRPPTPRKSDEPPFFMNILAMVAIAGAIFGANMIPSKRGHQD